MTLIKYRRPEVNLFGQSFTDVMDELFSEAVSANRDSFVPGTDISETENQFELAVHLPGLNREKIQVDIEGGRLSVSGERKFENESGKRTHHKVESRYGSFKRLFQLPDYVNEDSVKAVYKDGVLTVTFDKSREKVKKQITVK